MTRLPGTPATRLAGLLAGAGALHLVVPHVFDPMVPRWLPGTPRAWTQGSAVAEVAVAAAVAHPRTRARGALAAAALFVAVLPGSVQTAQDAKAGPARAAAVGRLPLQVPLVLGALRVRREA